LPDASLAAAVTLVESGNKAAALIDEGAFITVGGTVTLYSQAEENFQTSASGSADDTTSVGIGGAVSVSRIANQATAFIGHNAVVKLSWRDADRISRSGLIDIRISVNYGIMPDESCRLIRKYVKRSPLHRCRRSSYRPRFPTRSFGNFLLLANRGLLCRPR